MTPDIHITSSYSRCHHQVPLLSLAPPALALGDQLTVGEPGQDGNVGELWNVITRAADLVKDGQRLENLAWRHWANQGSTLRCSSLGSSFDTASSTSIPTPVTERSSYGLSRSGEKRTFGGALRLLLEDDTNFKDWVQDAKKTSISVPDTPAPVQIRLVEPTPVPSRVGSLGASMVNSMLAAKPPPVPIEDSVEEIDEESSDGLVIDTKARSKKRGKFFVHSSPGKSFPSEIPDQSPEAITSTSKSITASPTHRPRHRKSSCGSDKSRRTRAKDVVEQDRPPRRNVSLSMMRGRFQAEKRIAAKALEAKAAEEEDSGWEDEDDGDAIEGEAKVNRKIDLGTEEESTSDTEKPTPTSSTPAPAPEEAPDEDDGEWSDEPESREGSTEPNSVQSQTQPPDLDFSHLLTKSSRRALNIPPPPAPTPLRNMSRKERQAAAAERARIEAELEAQRKREMFAKQQIFGRPAGTASGLLTGLFNHHASMVNLTEGHAALRPSPTHGHLPSLSSTPPPAPNMLRSKSAVAMPVQSGVSVTVSYRGPLSDPDTHTEPEPEVRAPPGVELESDSESEGEDDYLATSQTKRKLVELATKRDKKVSPMQAPGVRFGESVAVQSISPTSRRRVIIMREMSESLRRNLILEREVSSGPQRSTHARPPPSTHTSVLPTRHSAANLQQHYGEPHEQGSSTGHPPKRTHSGLLSGFLRPLTRVETEGNAIIARTQSSGNISVSRSATPTPRSPPEAPAMVRSSTVGEASVRLVDKQAKKHALDTGYRAHGW